MSRPNILLLNSHDSGRFFGCYGVPTVRTPHIDALAASGVLLEQFTAASPICSPSRGAMMTGRWPQRNGLLGLTHHGFKLNGEEVHAAELFRRAGYATTLFHFQHVAVRDAWSALGYEEFLVRSRDEEFPCYPDMAIPAPELGAEVARWLGARKSDQPFFAHVNFNETHTPFDFGGVKPDTLRGVTVPPWIQRDTTSESHFALLQGAAAALDTGIGRILDALDACGLADDTLVVFAADHGLEAARDKWTLYESGIGIAGILRWPRGGCAGGRRIATPLSNVDLLPTLLDAAGVPIPDTLDGISFTQGLRGEPMPGRPVFSIYHNNGSRAVRSGRWKLIRNFSAEPYFERPPVSMSDTKPRFPRPICELYNLESDPHELANLAPEQPQMVRELTHLLATWIESTADPVISPIRP